MPRPMLYSLDGFLFCDSIFQCFTWFERGHAGSRDLDLLRGFGVAAHAGLTLLHLKGAEAHQTDILAICERGGDGYQPLLMQMQTFSCIGSICCLRI